MQELGAIATPMFKMKGPSMIGGKYPTAFPLKHQQKDMRLALALGDEVAQSMPVAAAANEVRNLSETPCINVYIRCPVFPYLCNDSEVEEEMTSTSIRVNHGGSSSLSWSTSV
jgi:hypothetical protein